MKEKLLVLLFFVALMFNSCVIEQKNLSPFSKNFSDGSSPSSLEDSYNYAIRENANVAEITNLISTFPKFRNEGINKEVIKLKSYLQSYIFALESYNLTSKERSLELFEKSYKRIQNLKKYLNNDEAEVLNRYLVRIKTNITVLESLNNPSQNTP